MVPFVVGGSLQLFYFLRIKDCQNRFMKYKWKALKSRIRRDVVLSERQRIFHQKISMRCSSRWLKEPLLILALCLFWDTLSLWKMMVLAVLKRQVHSESLQNLGNPKAKAVTHSKHLPIFLKVNSGQCHGSLALRWLGALRVVDITGGGIGHVSTGRKRYGSLKGHNFF